MATLKILFADDQIPDKDIPDQDVAREMMKKYPGAHQGFIDAFLPMRQAVKTIRDGGYDVTIARTYEEALRSIREKHFDIAIVDLRWDADQKVPSAESDNMGWKICEAIEAADRDAPTLPTFQIVYSSRFDREPHIAMRAGQESKLPLYKSYNEAGSLSLLAAVNFIDKYLSSTPALYIVAIENVKAYRQMVQQQLSSALSLERQWTMVTLVLVVLSVLLVIVGASVAVLGYIQVGTLTAISSVITSVISTLLLRQLNAVHRNNQENLKIADKNYRDAIKQLLKKEPANS